MKKFVKKMSIMPNVTVTNYTAVMYIIRLNVDWIEESL